YCSRNNVSPDDIIDQCLFTDIKRLAIDRTGFLI
ncbi:unnamed protein product, partial [Rotaria sp. Silwood2]